MTSIYRVNKAGCDVYGVTMPELRSGARRSRRLDDLQPCTQPLDQGENLAVPAPNRTRRRVGGGRGRGGNAAVAKGPSVAIPARPTAARRGRGIRLIDLDPEPCEVLPEAGALGAAEPVFNRVEAVANKDMAIEGGSPDKVIGVEEEAGTAPIPDRVSPCLLDLVHSLLYVILEYSVTSMWRLHYQLH